ncbi:MAG: HD-GYP domain-containing protein [Ilumatobacteraceae bacterium]
MTVSTMFGPWADAQVARPRLYFALVTIAAATCVAAATAVIAVADRREMAEVGLLGSLLMAASVMPMVHGLVTPNVLFDETAAFRTSSFLTLPIAVVIGLPLFVPHSSFGRWAARHWRDWTLLSLLGVFVVASLIVFLPDAITVPSPMNPITIVVSIGLAAAFGWMSLRQHHLYELGRHRANLIASASIAMLGVLALAPMVETRYAAAFWWVHLAGSVGVIGACAGLAVSSRLAPGTTDLLSPILTRDPLVAFELGLSPIVHQFVAEIGVKDQTTRDHVVRTCELAMRVGERFRLSAAELRDLGLAAMLHDVGKVNVPDSILKKPARLTAAEYDVMKIHPVDGESILMTEPNLKLVAAIVRSHHERFDGRGYPDGLVGRDIPLASRIIAACDALEAMTHDRQYRAAMATPMAFAILREHAGSQWDEAVVDQVIAVVSTTPTVHAFDAVGHISGPATSAAIPDDIGDLLVAVDAEI